MAAAPKGFLLFRVPSDSRVFQHTAKLHSALPPKETLALFRPHFSAERGFYFSSSYRKPRRRLRCREIFSRKLSRCLKIKTERLSNPFCSPRFRISVSGRSQLTAFAFGVPHDINGFHPYTVRSVSLLSPPVQQYLLRNRR